MFPLCWWCIPCPVWFCTDDSLPVIVSVAVSCIRSQSWLCSNSCCSVIIVPLRWCSWINKVSQQFIWPPFVHVFNSCSFSSFGPNSCLFCSMWVAYADCGLFVLIYLMCSLYLVLMALPDCPTYAILHVLHISLYIPLGFWALLGFCSSMLL